MPIHNLSMQPSLASVYLSELRDKSIQLDRMRFRRNIERLGEIMAYEISKTIQSNPIEVKTPLGNASGLTFNPYPVLGTILRAGLPFHAGFLSYYDKADNAFLSAYRKHDSDTQFHIELPYVACPDFNNRPLIVCDPMIATGRSMVETLKALFKIALPSQLIISCVIGALEGIEYIQSAFPQADIWAAGIDLELDKNAYIVPGLGDAGDLAFGSKIQK